MSEEDRRVHPRIQVSVNIRMSGPEGAEYGELLNLSRGGAGVILPRPFGAVGDIVELFLPFSAHTDITVSGEILRIREVPGGHYHGIRFSMVEPALYEKLETLNELLLGSKGKSPRKHNRV